MKKSKGYIGVFDSGFGGLAILKEIVKTMPDYTYVYLGDTARAPYGTRSAEMVDRFTYEAVDFLCKEGCELIVTACNTASAESLRQIQQNYLPKHYPDRRVLGVVVPAVEEAVEAAPARVGVLATPRTVASHAFAIEIQKRNPHIKVFERAAPLLVPLIEEGAHNAKAGRMILSSYLTPLVKKNIDTLILGCTHYGHIERAVRALLPKNVRVISGGTVVARKLKDYLKRHVEIEAKLSKKGGVVFYTTDLSDRFKRLGSMFYGKKIEPRIATLGV